MSEITDRLYALEAALPPRQRSSASWRMSQDVADAIAKGAGLALGLPRNGQLMGYPFAIDKDLPPASVFIEGAPASEGGGRLIPESIERDWRERGLIPPPEESSEESSDCCPTCGHSLEPPG